MPPDVIQEREILSRELQRVEQSLVVEQVLHKTGPLWFNIAQLAGLALGMVFRFTTYKRWVFLSPERAAARSMAEVDDDPAQPATSRTRV